MKTTRKDYLGSLNKCSVYKRFLEVTVKTTVCVLPSIVESLFVFTRNGKTRYLILWYKSHSFIKNYIDMTYFDRYTNSLNSCNSFRKKKIEKTTHCCLILPLFVIKCICSFWRKEWVRNLKLEFY